MNQPFFTVITSYNVCYVNKCLERAVLETALGSNPDMDLDKGLLLQ